MVKLILILLFQFSVQTHVVDIQYLIKQNIPDKEKKTHHHSVMGLTIAAYQNFISSQDKPSCIFSTSCSKFSSMALNNVGFFRGILLTTDRLSRCNGLSMHLYPINPENQRSIDTLWHYLQEKEHDIENMHFLSDTVHTVPGRKFETIK